MSPQQTDKFLKSCFPEHEWEIIKTDEEFNRRAKAAKSLTDLEKVAIYGHSVFMRKSGNKRHYEDEN